MAEEPEVIRHQIEQTRGRMDDTVDALAGKADVKSRAKGWVADKADAVTGKARDVTSSVGGSTPDSGDVKQSAQRFAGMVRDNPLGLAVGAAAAGFIVGLVIPSTAAEDRAIGPVADRVKDTAKDLGQEAVERGKEIGQRTAGAAMDTARQATDEQAGELKQSAQSKADDLSSGPQSATG